MQKFRAANNLAGWVVFLIAAATYVATLEPVASFWDCGEFIAASYKLQVPHPPGAPLFLLIGRFFSLFAGGDVTKVGFMVNLVSGLSSAGTSMLLFWSITMLGRKITGEPESATDSRAITNILAGLVGALAYTWSDSAWFSAVEAEVYAMSSLFTALVFWAILRWERVADEPGADKWILLIAYFTGLSIGVHLLNLVTMPALAMVYYFRRYKYSAAGAWATFLVGMVVVGAIMVGIIPGLPSFANFFELLFVNSFGLPFNSGIVFFFVLFVLAVLYGFSYAKKKQIPALYNGMWAFVLILIGYASYGVIIVRATHSPPLNENDPSNAISVVSYLKREQYGDRPLLYGPVYNSRATGYEKGGPVYVKGKSEYEIFSYKDKPVYPDGEQVLLPRIYSPQGGHIAAYKRWVPGLAKNPDRKPTLAQNIGFMIRYQWGHMYWRYFMWNFAGRASDVQNAASLTPFDTTKGLPESLANNKARNQFFMLPLILGLAGLYIQILRRQRDAFIVALLWFFTGIAIVIYLNQPPIEPRERDYTFAGSFYTFSIWIGLGVIALEQLLERTIRSATARASIAGVFCLGVPFIMIVRGWDDHDRSRRFFSVDSAKNLLNSCAKNAILFTGGDNDTFPLWYVQEVEGFRTDVRVCNLSLLGTDWYAKQMLLPAYDSKPLPMTLNFSDFGPGRLDQLPFYEIAQLKTGMDLPTYLRLVKEKNPALRQASMMGDELTIMPTHTFRLPVDVAKVRASGIVPEEDQDRIVPEIVWNINKGGLLKPDLLMLDMISTSQFERPIYFSTTLSPSNYLGLREYMYMEGLAYRLLPVRNQGAQEGVVNTPVMYENMMNKMSFRGMDDSRSYFDENYKRFPLNARKSFYMLAGQLLAEADQDSANGDAKRKQAAAVIDRCLAVMPDTAVQFDFYMPQFVPLLLKLGRRAQADKMSETMARRARQELDYYTKQREPDPIEVQTNAFVLQQLAMAYRQANITDKANQYNQDFEQYVPFLQAAQQGQGEYDDE